MSSLSTIDHYKLSPLTIISHYKSPLTILKPRIACRSPVPFKRVILTFPAPVDAIAHHGEGNVNALRTEVQDQILRSQTAERGEKPVEKHGETIGKP